MKCCRWNRSGPVSEPFSAADRLGLVDILVIEVTELGLTGQQRQDQSMALVGGTELTLDVLDVNSNRIGTDVELLSDFLFRMTATAQDKAVTLPSSQNFATLRNRGPFFDCRRHADAPFSIVVL